MSAERLRAAAQVLRDGGRTLMEEDVALALAEMLEGDAEDVDGIEDRFFEDGWMKTVLAVADAVLGGERS